MTASDSTPPNAINWQNLIDAGRDLIDPRRTSTEPTAEHIRKAISSAYYALFHALAGSNAESLIGIPHDPITTAAWSRVYRGLDHGTARRELQRQRHEFSAAAKVLAETFQDLQNRRHSADYNHSAVFTRQQAAIWLADAETAIMDYLQTDRGERAYIATLTLIRGR